MPFLKEMRLGETGSKVQESERGREKNLRHVHEAAASAGSRRSSGASVTSPSSFHLEGRELGWLLCFWSFGATWKIHKFSSISGCWHVQIKNITQATSSEKVCKCKLSEAKCTRPREWTHRLGGGISGDVDRALTVSRCSLSMAVAFFLLSVFTLCSSLTAQLIHSHS